MTIPGKPGYSPSELLMMNQVRVRHCNSENITKAFAIMADPNFDTDEKVSKIQEILDNANCVSIGRALDELHTLSELTNELQGGCDGLDALCYHLDMHTVNNAICALESVKNRFNEWQEIDSKNIEESVLKHRG